MQPDVEKLIELQEIDRELIQLREELGRYPQMRKVRQDEVTRARTQLEKAKLDLSGLEKRIRDTEREVRDMREALKRFALQQSQVKDQKSYDALTHEMGETERKISEADEQGAEFLIAAEEAERRIAELEKGLEGKERACEEELRRIEIRETQKQSLLQRFEIRRAQVVAAVQAPVLHRYDRLMRIYPGSAVAAVEEGNCGGCHMQITARRLQSIEEAGGIEECDSCHRFLYIPREP